MASRAASTGASAASAGAPASVSGQVGYGLHDRPPQTVCPTHSTKSAPAARVRTAPAGLRWALAQQRARGVAVCLLLSDPSAAQLLARHAVVFASLEEALWWLEEHVPGQPAAALVSSNR